MNHEMEEMQQRRRVVRWEERVSPTHRRREKRRQH